MYHGYSHILIQSNLYRYLINIHSSYPIMLPGGYYFKSSVKSPDTFGASNHLKRLPKMCLKMFLEALILTPKYLFTSDIMI